MKRLGLIVVENSEVTKSKESCKTNSSCAYGLARNALCHVIGVVSE